MAHDLVIRGGTVYDGTGAPGVVADIALSGGRIAEIGQKLAASDVLDASGTAVAPGFIDIHTHYDAQVFWDPALTPSCFHGVTSVVAGNCGFSIAPCRPEHHDLLAHTLEHVEDMNPATLAEGIPWDFESFSEYLDSVERRGVGLNFGCYVGHTAVRLAVMGDAGYEREIPTDAELTAMKAAVDEALEAGALGFASSSSPTHSGDGGRPVPSRLAHLEELEALLGPLHDREQGVIALLPGERITHGDVYGLQARIGRPLTWTALLTVKGFPWHEKVLADNDAHRANGGEVWPQISVRPLTFSMNLREPFTFNMTEPFRELMAGTDDERLRAFADPAWRARALVALDAGRPVRVNWDALDVTESVHPELIGSRVVDLASQRGCSPLDAMLDLTLAEGFSVRFRSVLANNDPDAIADLLPHPGLLLGLADSGAHVSQLCDACLPTDLLGNWVRGREVIDLPLAVHKLTGEPAHVFGLDRPDRRGRPGRGVLAPGMAADITVFEPDTVEPGPLRRVRDFPANGERLTADAPVGIRHVVVNGTVIRRDGATTGAGTADRPGIVLRA